MSAADKAPEVIARSDLIAVAPEALVKDRADRLQILPPPLPIASFTISL